MKLYIGYNGDMSARMIIFAPDAKTARKIAKKKIKEDELELIFPVLTFEKHEVKEGLIDVIQDEYIQY